MYYPQPTVSLAAAVALLRPSLRRHSQRASSLRRSFAPPPWVSARRRTAVSDDFFTVELDATGVEPEPDSIDDGLPSPWEGAVVYRRDAAVQHLEYASTLERLGLGDLSSPDSRARAADLGLAGGNLDSTGAAQPRTPVLVSVDVTRRRGRLRLDGIVRTVITLGCFRCAEPAPQGIFANFSLLLTEDPVEEEPDLGTIFQEDDDKGGASLACAMDGDQDIDWDDRLHFPAADKEIDISKHIRDMIHLEITLDAVCNPNCKGLCLTCGANLNTTSSCTCKPRNVQGLSPLKGVFK